MTVTSTLRRAWWLPVLGVVLGAALGLYLGLQLVGAGYTSTSQVLISGGGTPDSSDSAYNSNQYINQRMSTYAQFASSDQVVTPAGRELGVDPADLAGRIGATVAGDTTVLTLSVRGTSPQDAVNSARVVTRTFGTALGALETTPGQPPRATTQVISDPSMPASRFVPPLLVVVVVAALLGLLVMSLVAVVVFSAWFRRLARRVGDWLGSEPDAAPAEPTAATGAPAPMGMAGPHGPPAGAMPPPMAPFAGPPGRPMGPPRGRPMGPPPARWPAVDPTPTMPVPLDLAGLQGVGRSTGGVGNENTTRVPGRGEGSATEPKGPPGTSGSATPTPSSSAGKTPAGAKAPAGGKAPTNGAAAQAPSPAASGKDTPGPSAPGSTASGAAPAEGGVSGTSSGSSPAGAPRAPNEAPAGPSSSTPPEASPKGGETPTPDPAKPVPAKPAPGKPVSVKPVSVTPASGTPTDARGAGPASGRPSPGPAGGGANGRTANGAPNGSPTPSPAEAPSSGGAAGPSTKGTRSTPPDADTVAVDLRGKNGARARSGSGSAPAPRPRPDAGTGPRTATPASSTPASSAPTPSPTAPADDESTGRDDTG